MMCEPTGTLEAIAAIEAIEPPEAIGTVERVDVGTCLRLRLISGLEVLEAWSETAGQIEKNSMHEALFAIADCSVFVTHDIIDDVQCPREFYVAVKDDLVAKVRVHDFDAFGIVYLGSPGDAPDLDLGVDQAA